MYNLVSCFLNLFLSKDSVFVFLTFLLPHFQPLLAQMMPVSEKSDFFNVMGIS